MFQLTGVSIEIVNFSLNIIVVQLKLFNIGAQQFIIFAHSRGSLFESESFVEELFVIGQ